MDRFSRHAASVLCLCLLSLVWHAESPTAFAQGIQISPSERCERIQTRFGPQLARLYGSVKGMPAFDVDHPNGLRVLYSRDDQPCNALFIKENPELAEDCRKVIEEVVFINRFGNEVKVHIKGGEVTAIDIDSSYDDKASLKNRSVMVQEESLVVHDFVMDAYSKNLAKIFLFPGMRPVVRIDTDHNVWLELANKDWIRFDARDFRNAQSSGFRLSSKPKFIHQGGIRALPDAAYTGDRPHMVTTNWLFPPTDGYFTFFDGQEELGKIPASLFFKKQRRDRTVCLFKDEGLCKYLQQRSGKTSFRNAYGAPILAFVERVVQQEDALRSEASTSDRHLSER
jgi:hypothetical protein